MNKKSLAIGLVVIIGVIAIAGVYLSRQNKPFGALVGPDVFSYLDVRGFLSEGGGKTTATPTSGTYTITAGDLRNSNILTFTASTTMPALTANLPASTTFPLGTEVGSTRRWKIENPFTAAATTTTIGAGTGVDLQEPDGQNVVIGIDNYAWLECVRGLDSGSPKDIVCLVDESIPAD